MEYFGMSLEGLAFILFLLIGYWTLGISRAKKLPEPIILFILGVALKLFMPGLDLLLLFPFILIALLLLVFDAGAHFVPNKFTPHSLLISEFIIYSIFVNSAFFVLLLHFTFFYKVTFFSMMLSLLLGTMVSACSQFEILRGFKIKRNRLYGLTVQEDHLSNPIVLLISLTILSVITASIKATSMSDTMVMSLSGLLVDVAVGVFLGIMMLSLIVRVFKRKHVAPITVIFTLLCFGLSYALKGYGPISVLVMSLFFHNVSTKEHDMGEFGTFVSNIVYVFVFLAMGILVEWSIVGVIIALAMAAGYLLIRYLLLNLLFRHSMAFLTLDCPKGLALGALACFAAVMDPSLLFAYPLFKLLLMSTVIFFMICTSISYSVNLFGKEIID